MSETIETKFSYENFFTDINELCENGMDRIDAVIHWCDINDVDVELAASLIKKNSVLKSFIQEEAENLNFLKKTAKLPI